MKKLTMLVSLALLSSCTSPLRQPPSATNVKREPVSVAVTEETSTHELAEVNVDDVVIQQAAGSNDIDEDIKPSPEEQIPYARPFLVQKKTKRMQFWVEYFTQKQRERFQRFLNNGEEYRHHIEKIFEENNLPKELYYVGLIESGYYLGAKSHASAVGPWQFIKGTGTRYGLKVTSELDERQDLFKASRAAAMYFKDLHNIFSSWELALAAYNAGEYGIIRRILRHGTRDFYQLSKNKQLPDETINYVPKVLAAMHVVQNAKKYGFDLPEKKHRLFDQTELKSIKRNVSLNTIAQRLDVDVHLLKKLNPELKKGHTPRFISGNYHLRVPKTKYSYRLIDMESEAVAVAPEAAQRSVAAAKNLLKTGKPVVATVPDYHKVRRGETLLSISRKYRIPARELASLNGFKNWKTRVRVGQKLALNGNEAPISMRQASFPKVQLSKKPIVYKVRKGDNLTALSKVFGINLNKLSTHNRLKRGQIHVGQKLVLPSTKQGIYTVRKGDKLKTLAKTLGQRVDALKKLNQLSSANLRPGQKLIVNMD